MQRRFAILMLAATVAAADAHAAHWTVGFKGGVSIATAGGSDVSDDDDLGARTAFVGGGFAQADLSENFGFRFEGLYFMKGVTDNDSNFDGSFKLDYVEFPILIVGQAPTSAGVTLSAFAGPSFAINTSATAEVELGGIEFSGGIDEAISDFDIGLTFGAGAAFEAGSVVIVVDARYDYGLASYDDGLDADEELDITNQAWGFMAGVGFPVGTH